MGYTIQYEEGSQADRRAVLDMVRYIGFRRARLLAPHATVGSFQLATSFTGVTGRPAIAAHKRWSR